MLTDAITRRFSKHHAHLLAYMDAVEDVVRELAEAEEPEPALRRRRSFLVDFLDFMERVERRHELEEERVLLPVLEEQLLDSSNPLPRYSMQCICREHQAGHQLIGELRACLETLGDSESSEGSEPETVSSLLLELVWHYRRHVWAENSIIFPAAEKLIPDSADELWALNRFRRRQTNA